MSTKYTIGGMSCAACVARVENAVKAIEEVKDVRVSLLLGSMEVDGDVSAEKIIECVKNAGYEAVQSNETAMPVKKDIADNGTKIRLIISYICLAALLITEVCRRDGMLSICIIQGLLAFITIITNRSYFVRGFKGVIHRAPNMDTLVSLGAAVAFVYSTYGVIEAAVTGLTLAHKLYYVGTGMILTFILTGKSLEEKSKDKTTQTVKGLIELAPRTTVRVENNFRTTVDIANVNAGDIVAVDAGNYMPVDGIVVSGQGHADESGLTGESIPITKTVGDYVYTSTKLIEGSIEVKTEKVGEETTLAGIINMVVEAGSSKAPIARLADKAAGIFVPVVIVIAFVTWVIWMLLGYGTDYAFARAIAVLVVSCPCAMGLATPVAIMVGNGVGAKLGILFKNAESLEMAGKADTIVLDKTGTLTEGIIDRASDTGSDRLRADSKRAVQELKALGMKVYMLSGDKEQYAQKIANEAGIENVIFEVKPNEKAQTIKKLMEDGTVIMVGDGVNDSVALTQADVGMAVGCGKDVAIDAADIVLMHNSLLDAAEAIKLSRLTMRKIKQNLFWAFIYNIIGIPLAAGVFAPAWGIELPPGFSAAAMSLSSSFVVLNALTINKYKSREKTKMITKTMVIEGMMCPHCEARVKKCLEEINGVTQAVVSHEKGNAVVTMSESIDDKLLEQTVTAAGYEVKAIS